MKTGRLIVSLIGLGALALAYYTGNLYFLVIAVLAFVVGLYLMGANKKPASQKSAEKRAPKKQ